jgi:hypothetical protein
MELTGKQIESMVVGGKAGALPNGTGMPLSRDEEANVLGKVMRKRMLRIRAVGLWRFPSTLLNCFGEFVYGGVYIIGCFKGNMKIYPGVQQDLELVPVCWSRSESRRFRGQDRMEVKG